jgi:hypothetical protein
MSGFYKDTSGTSGIPPQTSTEQSVLQQPTSEPASLNEVKVRAQPQQQQQGARLNPEPLKEKKKVYTDFFRSCGRPIHRYPVQEHPSYG